jgi:hypothetical protein
MTILSVSPTYQHGTDTALTGSPVASTSIGPHIGPTDHTPSDIRTMHAPPPRPAWHAPPSPSQHNTLQHMHSSSARATRHHTECLTSSWLQSHVPAADGQPHRAGAFSTKSAVSNKHQSAAHRGSGVLARLGSTPPPALSPPGSVQECC